MIRVLIADDHPIVRRGLQALVSVQDDMEVVDEAVDGADAVSKARTTDPDVILMDLMMPRKDGVSATVEIIKAAPTARILVLTSFGDEEKIFAAIDAGALGFILKESPPERLIEAIRDVAAGRSSLDSHAARAVVGRMRRPSRSPLAELSRRERQVLALLGEGLSNHDIGTRLALGEHTVAKHVSNLLAKLGIENRTQAALLAVRLGVVKVAET